MLNYIYVLPQKKKYSLHFQKQRYIGIFMSLREREKEKAREQEKDKKKERKEKRG
jgi:hypothetical protein